MYINILVQYLSKNVYVITFKTNIQENNNYNENNFKK